jgi:hypothetical protein
MAQKKKEKFIGGKLQQKNTHLRDDASDLDIGDAVT